MQTITNASQAVLVTTQSTEVGYLRQFLVITIGNPSTPIVYARITNGGRGTSNAWTLHDYKQFVNNPFGNEQIVGAVLSSPLTDVDMTALNNNNAPVNVIQKLTKQFGLRDKVFTGELLGAVVADIANCIDTDPALLSKFRSDGRSDKSATTSVVVPQRKINVPMPAPLVKEVARVFSTELPESLHKYVPSLSDPEVASYIERTINGVKEFDMFRIAMEDKQNIAIKGEAGTGKTTAVKVFAAKMGIPFYSVSMNATSDPSEFFGMLEPQEDGSFKFVDGQLTLAFRYGGAVLFDELTFAKENCTSSIHNALDGLRQVTLRGNNNEIIYAHPNLLIVGAYNEGYRGNRPLNQAFADRFHIKKEFKYDKKIESQIIPSKSLLDLADKMRDESAIAMYETPISLRLLKNFVYQTQRFNFEFAVDSFLNSFTDEERPSVKLLLEAYSINIATELNADIDVVEVDKGDDN
jgi:hypothetical protein